ncbi:SDR family oxidoreductase [Sinisalibacter aestuarii]|uniref:3-alpha-(Or 20-beta)-hydroxysteroid dehydrogenase n=1 Tax=Sinisalibacter aestuarii TaxID=2949426 RepID=A0ABQ5LZM5_9RHOB|nr:SDR family oxidoreductase [Sinisalibacter aestuarii]GKY89905.1 3-alpha-(or 20-beta)-hydroxysteroid dehydrogenase [Sinisalibacter aestuarii]
MSVEGKVVLISGAAKGMGAHHSRVFAAAGAKLVLGDVLDNEVNALADELGENAIAVHLDVSKTADWDAAVNAAMDRFGRIDVLVNNAGILRIATIEDYSDEVWDQVIAVNLSGMFKGIRAVIPAMTAASGGSIINISSTAGLKGFQSCSAYISSKFGVRGLTKAAAIELAEHNIRVNSVHPGNIETEMTDGLYPNYKHVPMNRIGRPDEISKLVLFLASDDSSFSTAAEFVADGGETGGMPNLFA